MFIAGGFVDKFAGQRAPNNIDVCSLVFSAAVCCSKDQVESLYSNTIFVGCALLVTSLLLFFSDRMAGKRAKSATLLDAPAAWWGWKLQGRGGDGRQRPVPVGDHHLRRHDAGVPPEVCRAVLFLLSIPAVLGANIPHHRGCRPAGD